PPRLPRSPSPFGRGRRPSANPAPCRPSPVPLPSSTGSLLRAALLAASRTSRPSSAASVASMAISVTTARADREDNRSSAVREEQFVTGEVVRLLASGAIEKCDKPRVVSPLSVVQGDASSLLSRSLLSTIAAAQLSSLSPNTRCPISAQEQDSRREVPSPLMPSPTPPDGTLQHFCERRGENFPCVPSPRRSQRSIPAYHPCLVEPSKAQRHLTPFEHIRRIGRS
ncbi:hypothetical protein PMAYCL1PPCAC_03645, partial [Pristionchus mayeri]